MENNTQFWINDLQRHWVIGIDPKKGITHFGLDAEDTGRAETNLLADPIRLTWDGCSEQRPAWRAISKNRFETL